jgi:hypothetical protein
MSPLLKTHRGKIQANAPPIKTKASAANGVIEHSVVLVATKLVANDVDVAAKAEAAKDAAAKAEAAVAQEIQWA